MSTGALSLRERSIVASWRTWSFSNRRVISARSSVAKGQNLLPKGMVGLIFSMRSFARCCLAAGTFYFPTSAGYMSYKAADAGKTMAIWEVGSWLLENFASVEEVKANIGKIVDNGSGCFSPRAHDSSGHV